MADDDKSPLSAGETPSETVPEMPPPPQGRDWRLFNVVLLGLAFMLMFTAFQTCSNIEQLVLEGVHESNHSNETTFSKGAGYTSLAIIYAVFAASNWLAPSVVAVVTAKWAMFIGGILYSLFIASFLRPSQWSLYVGSVLIGFGAAVIWTGQGSFLTVNSNVDTMGRNSGIFWALLQCSMLTGNLFVYFIFAGETSIDDHSRTIVFTALTAAAVLGLLTLLLLRTKPYSQSGQSLVNVNSQTVQVQQKGPVAALKQSVRLLITKEMLLLSFPFAYTGLELTFFSGVYGTVVGHTLEPRYVGLIGVSVGVGEILGGSVFGLLGKRTNRFGRDPIVLLGFLVHMAAFYLVYLYFPVHSPLQHTEPVLHHNVYIEPHLYIAVIVGFLLGLGDSSYNTQIFSLLGNVYSETSAPAFAIYKFVQSLAAAAGFFYSRVLLLQWQLLILVVFNFLGVLGFFLVEWSTSRAIQQGYARI